MTLSSCKSDLLRAIIHFSCIYPLIQWSLLVMPNIPRRRNRKYIKTQQKQNFILTVLNLKHSFCFQMWGTLHLLHYPLPCIWHYLEQTTCSSLTNTPWYIHVLFLLPMSLPSQPPLSLNSLNSCRSSAHSLWDAFPENAKQDTVT